MARRPYNLKAWRYTRLAKLSACPCCEHCGKPATCVDHIMPIEDGGHPFDQSNLQSLCAKCHNVKTASVDGGFGNRKKRGRLKGCKADGTPLDPRHEWNMEKKFTRRLPANRVPSLFADLVSEVPQ